MRIPIHFSRWFVPLAVLTGMPPARCHLDVGADEVHVVMGWAFQGRLPRSVIASATATHVGLWAGIGVHGWRGTWVVNGSLRRMVELRLAAPVRARVLGFPVRLRRLFVSVEDPAGLLAALA